MILCSHDISNLLSLVPTLSCISFRWDSNVHSSLVITHLERCVCMCVHVCDIQMKPLDVGA